MNKGLKWFAIITTIGMLLVLLGGALVTKTESGAGCGDSWPLCHGELIPSNITFELVVELSHRLVSGSVGFLVLILSIWTWKKIGHLRETKFLSILSFSFLVIQALIGAAAVMWGQSSTVLALHFGISLISFAAVLLLTLLVFEADQDQSKTSPIIDKRIQFHIIGLILYCYVVVYTGALVRHKNASLACPDWPICNFNQLGLPTQLHEWIQMGHRLLAGLLFIWIIYATYIVIRHYSHQTTVKWSFMIAAILVSLQVISGAFIVITKLEFLFIALLHAFFISCLFGVLSYLVLLLTRSKYNQKVNQESSTKSAQI
ncbi:cytochrome c oxidase assembly protein subunit 15 [Bacillus mesophilus]|uniref:Heme A synthase n=1 Tax=Bacillus mesophilus TaxID=1808955 RepID=A0A6M0Q5I4_9BACI|nr:heme A synthase [Bacillus mesophilus]MBM7659505.1 cytochrome c oxidase assembly protein subunit 15 [Bacillus mesophilus]NEY70378.1 heme A synthase [Bacillus mesophilus]